MSSTSTRRIRPPSAAPLTEDAEGEWTLRVALLETADAPLAARYRTLGIETLHCQPGVTLGRGGAASGALEITDAAEGVVAVGALIAEGGMGEIRSALQHHLRREVAVKRAREGATEYTHQAMLREAWIAGSLEHPNILPIHTLSRDGAEPLIVMKRVEGRVWSEVLREAQAAKDERLTERTSSLGDRWLEPIRVLIEVCRAVHFAHSRGVLHLDLKPDNVMVGEHGEVVLLDWGIAAAFDTSRAPEFITSTESIDHVCGTLGYLSPEQATAAGSDFSPRTDVYLLGAVLHEVLTGAPPHPVTPPGSPMLSLVSSHQSEARRYGLDVPEELGQIARRALSRAPAERYADADEFRRALEAFVEHRPALALTARANALRREIEHSQPLSEVERGRRSRVGLSDEVSTEARLDACRFAYQQALRSWPECDEARAGLAWIAELLMRRAEASLDVAAGLAALAEHPSPDERFAARQRALEEAAKADAERVAELRAISADEDLNTDRAVRIRLALTGGASWSVWNAFAGVLDRSGVLPVTHTVLLTNAALAFSVFLMVLASVGRRPLTSTAVNRRALTIVLAAFAQTFVLWLGAAALGVAAHHAAVLAFAIYVLAGMSVAAVLDPRTWWGSVLMLPLAFGAARAPEYVFYFTAGLGPIGGAGLAYLWWKPAPPLPHQDHQDHSEHREDDHPQPASSGSEAGLP